MPHHLVHVICHIRCWHHPCHVSSFQWWHMSPPNRSIRTPKCPNLSTTSHYLRLPHVSYMYLPCQRTDMPHQHSYGLYGLHNQQFFFFACLTFRTECDIFSIQSPFDKVNIPQESWRRDECNGIGFVALRALSFLSIFHTLSGFWIQFRITHPHNKTFWSPKGYWTVNKLGIGHLTYSLSLNSVLCTLYIYTTWAYPSWAHAKSFCPSLDEAPD